MNKKVLMLSLGLGIFLVGCQTDSVTEELPTNEVSLEKESKDSQVNKIHEPGFINGIHEPGFLKNGFEDCDIFPAYTGPANMNIMKGESFDYGQKVEVQNLRVGGDLNICGEINIEKDAIIRRNGVLKTVGLMTVGTEEKPKDLVINYGGHLEINGALIVTGDLILNTGATLQYLNADLEHNYLWVMGKVRTAEYSFLRGEYNVYTAEEHNHDDHEH